MSCTDQQSISMDVSDYEYSKEEETDRAYIRKTENTIYATVKSLFRKET